VKIVEEYSCGVVVYQLTDGALPKSNIYCEQPFCPPDSSGFLYTEQVSESDCRYLFCEFGTWETVEVGRGFFTQSVPFLGLFHYLRPSGTGASRELVRLDLSSKSRDVVGRFSDGVSPKHVTVSPDGRYLAYGRVLSYSPQRFAVELMDTQSGERRIIYEDEHIFNPHCQFEPGRGEIILIQQNRGCRFSEDGKVITRYGEEGPTVFMLRVRDGQVLPLRIGFPHTPFISGHQTWVGASREVIATLRPRTKFLLKGWGDEYTPEKGNTVCVSAEGNVRRVGAGKWLNHIGCTPCGRFFCGDTDEMGEVVAGSTRTGRMISLFKTRMLPDSDRYNQQSHPHAYLSPDHQWVVFLSTRTGSPQIHAASIPEGLLEPLEEEGA